MYMPQNNCRKKYKKKNWGGGGLLCMLTIKYYYPRKFEVNDDVAVHRVPIHTGNQGKLRI